MFVVPMSKISEKRLENHLWISLTALKLQDSNYRFMQKKTPAQILSQGSQYFAIQITNIDSYTTVSSSTEELLLGITINRNLSFNKLIRVLCSKTNNKLHLLFHISILHEFTNGIFLQLGAQLVGVWYFQSNFIDWGRGWLRSFYYPNYLEWMVFFSKYQSLTLHFSCTIIEGEPSFPLNFPLSFLLKLLRKILMYLQNLYKHKRYN